MQERIAPRFDLAEAIKEQHDQGYLNEFLHPLKPLLPFEGNLRLDDQPGIPFEYTAYSRLVDTTGRIVREDKRGAIPDHLPPILQRLGLAVDEWLLQATAFEKNYQTLRRRRTTNK